MRRSVRVLHIVSGDLWAGAEVQALTLMRHLARSPDTEVAAVLMNEGILAERLRSVGIDQYVFDERKVGPLSVVRRLREVLRRWRPDVIHTHREKENILGSLANLSCGHVPCVRTVHGGGEHKSLAGWQGARRQLIDVMDRWCGAALQDRVIAVSQELATSIAEVFPAQRVVVIENGVDAEALRAEHAVAEFRSAGGSAIHVGVVGRLVPVKRIDLFIEAAALLTGEVTGRPFQFHVFGEGPLLTELTSMMDRAHVRGRMTFHGQRLDIAACLRGLDVLVICSDHEGMPMTALEAAALETPTVAHAVGGLPDVVPEEFLVTRHNGQGYRDGILRALRDDGRVIARNRAKEVVLRFSAQRNAEQMRMLYAQVIRERVDAA